MTWENRFRLLLGVLGVVVLVSALTIVFNQRQNQISSYSGAVAADEYTVGADYAGTVVRQDVQQGEAVKRGQQLFVIQSLQLQEKLANGLEVLDTDAYKVNAKHGTITYYAVTDGQVKDLNARLGNSVAGGSLATIAGDNRYILAKFRLVPRDYARVHPGSSARIRLADDQTVTGTVSEVRATTGETGTASTIRITSSDLAKVTAALAAPGAPVYVTVALEDSGPLAGLRDALTDALAKIGLA
jgi:multidrug resistance efflux pump